MNRLIWSCLYLTLCGCQPELDKTQSAQGQRKTSSPTMELAPPHWPPGELEKFTGYHNTFEQTRSVVTGSKTIIAGTQSALGVGAGQQVLRKGGNAMDAALAAAFAQTVTQGGYGVSFAGWMAMLYYDATTDKVHALNAGYNTVLGEDDPESIPHYANGSGARAVLVPGYMAGAEAAHRRFGRLPWRGLFESAIWFAEQGIRMPARLAKMVEWKKEMLAARPEAAAIFMQNGQLKEGDLFRQPALASTLRQVADHGAAHMYRGAWAKKFVQALQAEGGKMRLEDLGQYEPTWSEPWETTFAGHRVLTQGAPAYGGYQLLEMLNLVEAAGILEVGDYTKSSEALASFIRTSQAVGFLQPTATHNFGAGYGELVTTYFPDIDVTPEARITKAHAEKVWAAMNAPAWQQFVTAVMEKKIDEIRLWDRMLQGMDKPQRTDCVIVVDDAGNVATLLHTFNGLAWGYGLFVDGVSIPDSGSFQQKLIAQTGPGKRLPDPTHPVMVLDDSGLPVLASNTAGSWIHGATSQFLFNVLVEGMDPADAINTAQFWKPALVEGTVNAQVGVGDFSPAVLGQVRALGVPVMELDQAQHYGRSSYVLGVGINRESGELSGGFPAAFNGAVVAD